MARALLRAEPLLRCITFSRAIRPKAWDTVRDWFRAGFQGFTAKPMGRPVTAASGLGLRSVDLILGTSELRSFNDFRIYSKLTLGKRESERATSHASGERRRNGAPREVGGVRGAQHWIRIDGLMEAPSSWNGSRVASRGARRPVDRYAAIRFTKYARSFSSAPETSKVRSRRRLGVDASITAGARKPTKQLRETR